MRRLRPVLLGVATLVVVAASIGAVTRLQRWPAVVSPDTATPPHVDARLHAAGSPAPRVTSPAAEGTVSFSAAGWYSWALLDTGTGKIVGGGDGTSTTESMIKVWIAADYLSGVQAEGRTSLADWEDDLLSRMLRQSDDDAAEILYQARGADPVIERMITTCGLTGTTGYEGWWSLTEMSASDAARMGRCVADGRLLDVRWTAYLLGLMRTVQPDDAFGIAQALPAGTGVAVKNGWTEHPDLDEWHVNCLAVTDGWVLAVLTRYPAELGRDYGAGVCWEVAERLALR